MNKTIDLRHIADCPNCGRVNTTTEELCMLCSLAKRRKNNPEKFDKDLIKVMEKIK